MNRRLKRELKKYARRFYRKALKQPKALIKQNMSTAIIGTLITMPVAGYSLTSLTTDIPFTQPVSIVKQIGKAGPANILTGGIAKPLQNSVKNVTGNVKVKFGEKLNKQEWIAEGQSLKNQANAWFDIGKGQFNDKVKDIQILGSSDETFEALSEYEWNPQESPDYYKVVGLADIDPSEFPPKSQIEYSDVDHLNRTGPVKGTLSYETKQASIRFKKENGSRQSFPSGMRLSGWPAKNQKVAIPDVDLGRTYNGWMYNRSHLIGDAIGGDAIQENAITGTRPQNVGQSNQRGGMRYPEMIAEKYLDEPGSVLYYEAVPVYQEDELIPRVVNVRLMSHDKKINEKVVVYNTALGWDIDYHTGEFSPAK